MSFQKCQIVGKGIDSSKYHDVEVKRGDAAFPVSPSMLRAFAPCPSRWLAGYTPPPSEAKAWGSLLDCLALTPLQFPSRYATRPATYETTGMKCPSCGSITDSKKCAACKTDRMEISVTKDWNAASKTCQEWIAAQNGKEIIGPETFTDAKTAYAKLISDPVIKTYNVESDAQVALAGEWLDKATGLTIPVRCLLDYAPRADSEFAGGLGDLKTTRNAAPWQWQRWVYQSGYHVQAAFDLDLYNAATGEERTDWVWIVQENYPPYETAKRLCSLDLLAIGRVEYRNALAAYARCLKTKEWPGYDAAATESQGWTIVEGEPWMMEKAMAGIPSQSVTETPQPETDEDFDVVP